MFTLNISNNKLRRLFLILMLIIVFIGVASVIYFTFFHYNLICGKADEVNCITAQIQLSDGVYESVEFTDTDEIKLLFSLFESAADGKKEIVRLYPGHGYTKDSYITFYVEYENDFQLIHIGYDDKMIFEIDKNSSLKERGYAIISCDKAENSLKSYVLSKLN